MLEGGVWRDGETIFDGLSLNDVVVSRGATAEHGRAARSTSATSSSPTCAPTA